jgi:hypothetical protein
MVGPWVGVTPQGLMEQPPMQLIPGPEWNAKIPAQPIPKAVNPRKNP